MGNNIEKLKEEIKEKEKKIDQIINYYRKQNFWALNLLDRYGVRSIVEMDLGFSILSNKVDEAIAILKTKRKDEALDVWDWCDITMYLPDRFADKYNMAFFKRLKNTIESFKTSIRKDPRYSPCSVIEELIVCMVCEIAEDYQFAAETNDDRLSVMNLLDWFEDAAEEIVAIEDENIPDEESEFCRIDQLVGHKGWEFDFLGDMDVVTWLFGDIELSSDNNYHFDNWFKNQYLVE